MPHQRWLDADGRLIATGGRNAATWWMHWPGLATFWFGESGDVRAEPLAAGLDHELHDIFARGVTPVVLLARGWEGLHASAVLGARGVVPLIGRSGTGKSTAALAVAAAGVPHFADDTLVYSLADGCPIAARLPYPVRVDAAARGALGSGRADRVADENAALLHRIYHLVRDVTLDPRRPSFSPVPPNARFELLLAHAHPMDMAGAARRRAFIEHLMLVAQRVDVWECRFAPDLVALPSLADALRRHIDD